VDAFHTIPSSFQAKCDTCGTHISHRGGSTSNLAKHIRSKHPALAEGLTTRSKKFQPTAPTVKPTTDIAVSVSNEEISADQSSATCFNAETVLPSRIVTKQQSQQKLTSYVVRPTTVARQKRLDSLLLKMVVCDFQPFSVVEDEGFRDFVAALDPSYAIPSRWTVTKDLLVTAYNKVVDPVKELLSTTEFDDG
jgi:BED zinc finger